jgi:hypothetical protein
LRLSDLRFKAVKAAEYKEQMLSLLVVYHMERYKSVTNYPKNKEFF